MGNGYRRIPGAHELVNLWPSVVCSRNWAPVFRLISSESILLVLWFCSFFKFLNPCFILIYSNTTHILSNYDRMINFRFDLLFSTQGSLYVDLAVLEVTCRWVQPQTHRDAPAFASSVPRLKVSATTPWLTQWTDTFLNRRKKQVEELSDYKPLQPPPQNF